MKKAFEKLSDEELVLRMKSGDNQYFSVFVDRYESYITKKCKSYVKDEDAANDLSQEVMIKVFLQVSKFRTEAKLTTWLFSIIHNTCIDYLRSKKKRTHDVISEKLADEVFELVDADEELPEEKTVEILETLLDQMTPEGKLILLLKYKEKHSIQDIQNSLGLSESAVKMRLKRAKEMLNKLYSESLRKPK
ncbi:RNA polymerase sigma factor [Ekhidna sp.]|uniref:RNA polymerase sigma factor n=1 Tax=Ekhidna sp. TaxID=2608089 RepID=UPI003515F43C